LFGLGDPEDQDFDFSSFINEARYYRCDLSNHGNTAAVQVRLPFAFLIGDSFGLRESAGSSWIELGPVDADKTVSFLVANDCDNGFFLQFEESAIGFTAGVPNPVRL